MIHRPSSACLLALPVILLLASCTGRPTLAFRPSASGDLYWTGEFDDSTGDRWEVAIIPGLKPIGIGLGKSWRRAVVDYPSWYGEGWYWNGTWRLMRGGLEFAQDAIWDFSCKSVIWDFFCRGGVWSFACKDVIWDFACKKVVWNFACKNAIWEFACKDVIWEFACKDVIWDFVCKDVIWDFTIKGSGGDWRDTTKDLGGLVMERPFGWLPRMMVQPIWGYLLKPCGRLIGGLAATAGGLVVVGGSGAVAAGSVAVAVGSGAVITAGSVAVAVVSTAAVTVGSVAGVAGGVAAAAGGVVFSAVTPEVALTTPLVISITDVTVLGTIVPVLGFIWQQPVWFLSIWNSEPTPAMDGRWGLRRVRIAPGHEVPVPPPPSSPPPPPSAPPPIGLDEIRLRLERLVASEHSAAMRRSGAEQLRILNEQLRTLNERQAAIQGRLHNLEPSASVPPPHALSDEAAAWLRGQEPGAAIDRRLRSFPAVDLIPVDEAAVRERIAGELARWLAAERPPAPAPAP